MIDFKNGSAYYAKMKPVNNQEFESLLATMLIPEEHIVASFKGIRDGVVFTSKRIITINIQGVTGKKKDFTSLPYSKIQAYSVETAGLLDFDSELDMWFSGLGRVRIEFIHSMNIEKICKLISQKVL